MVKTTNPDVIQVITHDLTKLPEGEYKECGFESRQLFYIDIIRSITEYQAQVLENSQGQQFVAPFPKGVK